MFIDSQSTVFLIRAVLIALALIVFARLPSLIAIRNRNSSRFREVLPAWLASLLGLLAVLSLGIAIPLPVIDSFVMGNNNSNLLQSSLTLGSFWFFRDAVHAAALDQPPHHRKRVLAGCLAGMSIPFFLIEDRGAASSSFMVDNAAQLPNVVYNIIYMLSLAWIVISLAWPLRRLWRSAYSIFLIGLAFVFLSTLDECGYIVSAYLAPSPVSDWMYAAFYYLFFGGILIVAIGWSWVIIYERDYIGSLRWRFRGATLVPTYLRLQTAQRRAVKARRRMPVEENQQTTSADLARRSSPQNKPRLRFATYVAPQNSRAFALLTAHRGSVVLNTLSRPDAEDGVFRMVVHVRNTATRNDLVLSQRDAARLRQVERHFPGFVPA